MKQGKWLSMDNIYKEKKIRKTKGISESTQ